MPTPSASILLAVYNKVDIVARTLSALNRQSVTDFEVILCDDGSDPALKAALENLIPSLSYPVTHVWQEDLGFRKCRALNAGLLKTRSDYILVLDPDCIPHRKFVQGHLEERRRGLYLSGRRLMLGASLSSRIETGALDVEKLESFPFLLRSWCFQGGGRHLESGIYLPAALRKLKPARELALKGCNMSFWKWDIEALNGFDETFEIPCGGEDTDLERRFRLLGLRSRSVKNAAVCYHLDHRLLPRDGQSDRLCQELAEKNNLRALKGLTEHQANS